MPGNSRLDELRRRLHKDPASIAFAQLAEEHRRAGEYDEAVHVCRAGLAQHPGYLSARVTLGRALIELGRLEEAADELERVLATAPDNLAAERARQDLHLRGYRRPHPPTAAAEASGQPLAGAGDPRVHAAHRSDHDGAALLQLESWLSAILVDRRRRHAEGN